MEHTRMIRTAQVLDKLAKVLSVIFLVVSVLMVVLGGACALIVGTGGANLGQGTPEIAFGPLSLELADGAAVSSAYYTTISVAILVGGLFVLVVSRVGFRAIRSILEPMTVGRPFEERCSRALKTLALLTLVGGACAQVGTWIMTYLMSLQIDVVSLFAPEAVTGVTVHFTFGVNFLLFAAILYLLSFVFRYGEVLQRESDETV
ncbi:MAG: DUF2975 domain-containing protein [Clostridiales bacterium]|nr:DUF2975 domain-containing protein [Clostridiales bacterium]